MFRFGHSPSIRLRPLKDRSAIRCTLFSPLKQPWNSTYFVHHTIIWRFRPAKPEWFVGRHARKLQENSQRRILERFTALGEQIQQMFQSAPRINSCHHLIMASIIAGSVVSHPASSKPCLRTAYMCRRLDPGNRKNTGCEYGQKREEFGAHHTAVVRTANASVM